MQSLIEKIERAIEIDKQDAASSDVAEIKTVARYRGPMLEQFVDELKDVSAAVDAALDAKSKLIAALERELEGASGGDAVVVNDYKIAVSEEADASYLKQMSTIGWNLVTVVAEGRYSKMVFRRPLPNQ